MVSPIVCWALGIDRREPEELLSALTLAASRLDIAATLFETNGSEAMAKLYHYHAGQARSAVAKFRSSM